MGLMMNSSCFRCKVSGFPFVVHIHVECLVGDSGIVSFYICVVICLKGNVGYHHLAFIVALEGDIPERGSGDGRQHKNVLVIQLHGGIRCTGFRCGSPCEGMKHLIACIRIVPNGVSGMMVDFHRYRVPGGYFTGFFQRNLCHRPFQVGGVSSRCSCRNLGLAAKCLADIVSLCKGNVSQGVVAKGVACAVVRPEKTIIGFRTVENHGERAGSVARCVVIAGHKHAFSRDCVLFIFPYGDGIAADCRCRCTGRRGIRHYVDGHLPQVGMVRGLL